MFNQWLDVLLKLALLITFPFFVMVLRDIDHAIRTAGKSAESLERTAENVETATSFLKYLPNLRPKRKEDGDG